MSAADEQRAEDAPSGPAEEGGGPARTPEEDDGSRSQERDPERRGPDRASLIVIAKAPVAGHSKTRLCPPCTPEQAAALAQAALADTLAAVAATPAPRHVIVLDGEPGPWLPAAFEVMPQEEGGLDRRLAGAFERVGGPALLVGMDTPQVTPELLVAGLRALARRKIQAVLGAAHDGGYWAIGLKRPDRQVFEGVPMSEAETGAAQRRRLDELALRRVELPRLRDVDTIADARAVAAEAPRSRFARLLSEFERDGLLADEEPAERRTLALPRRSASPDAAPG